MASIRMSSYLRSQIMSAVGKYLPAADSYKVKSDVTEIFLKHRREFVRLAVEAVIPQQFLSDSVPIIPGYQPSEYLESFTTLNFILPTIYLPRIPDNTGASTSTLGETNWRNNNLAVISVGLNNKLYLPHIHKCSTYDDHLRKHRNNINPTGELLELLDDFAVEANTYLAPLQNHSRLHHQLRKLLGKFHTIKQLTDAWPEIEAFIPSEYLGESIKQKKAKKVPLTLVELNRIDEISKELLIQKMLIN